MVLTIPSSSAKQIHPSPSTSLKCHPCPTAFPSFRHPLCLRATLIFEFTISIVYFYDIIPRVALWTVDCSTFNKLPSTHGIDCFRIKSIRWSSVFLGNSRIPSHGSRWLTTFPSHFFTSRLSYCSTPWRHLSKESN